ncbi:MAG: hypothetical protein LBL86_03710 [Coriobacteriales bacterium]|jgi:hypothetical protein|nr:hypothetical protein [Coriobacteriales bacterium]
MDNYRVIIPTDISPYPWPHEVSAAVILAEHFQADVEFLKRIVNSRSADVLIKSTIWEIKSPTGKGKRNIQHTLSAALKQSRCIVFDARRSKIHIDRIAGELQKQLAMTASIERLILIRKDKTALELSR